MFFSSLGSAPAVLFHAPGLKPIFSAYGTAKARALIRTCHGCEIAVVKESDAVRRTAWNLTVSQRARRRGATHGMVS